MLNYLIQYSLGSLIGLLIANSVGAAPIETLIGDPEVLTALELSGHGSLQARFTDKLQKPTDNQTFFARNSGYRSMVASLEDDLKVIAASDPLLSVTMSKSHRLFDARWLTSSDSSFELVAVVNRMDRQPFHPRACGELRFVYRLKYVKESNNTSVTSRLPFSVNVVYLLLDEKGGQDCANIARRWQLPIRKESVDTLTKDGGPLAPSIVKLSRLKSVEINMQSVRWPSTVRGDMGAHAEYLLRVFKPTSAGTLALAPLENTPDVERIQSNADLKKELLAWLQRPEIFKKIDQGIVVLPEKFLTRKATSVSPRGLARLANRPFSQLFESKDFIRHPYLKARYVRSPAALLRRLDDMSCTGCHQNRTVAGFHLLGKDRAETARVNAVHVFGSPHLSLDMERRMNWVSAHISGKIPSPERPFSERADVGEGGYGSHCGLGDIGFESWSCNAGLECQAFGVAIGDRTVGQCFATKAAIGDPCEVGRVKVSTNSHKDRVVQVRRLSCGKQKICEVNYVGFPEGMCAGSCENLGENGSCGAIALLTEFNTCLAKRRPFTKCIEDNVRPAGLRACSNEQPCRDDYLCVNAKDDEGACIPPYFLFQMRVDGHPTP